MRLGPGAQGGGRVELLARVSDRDQLESALEGWREQCGEPRSLAWLRGRAARLGGRARVTQARMAARMAGTGARLAASTLALR